MSQYKEEGASVWNSVEMPWQQPPVGKGVSGKGKGKSKGMIGSKGNFGKGRRHGNQEGPQYDAATPCGYYIAGFCRRGSTCVMQHSIQYALAIRSEWLKPKDLSAKDALRAIAEQTLGASTIQHSDLFPRVFSRQLSASAHCVLNVQEVSKDVAGRTSRWNKNKSICSTNNEDDGFAWEHCEELQTIPNATGLAPVVDDSVQQKGQIRYLLILDLEGKEEIIEFPVIAIDTWTLQEVGRFQRYVRPVKLFDGCAETPESPAIHFHVVLQEFDMWLQEIFGCGLEKMGGAQATMAFLTCGDWDCKHVHTQCGICGVPTPRAFRQWVNIKRSYSQAFGGEFRGMKSMLSRLRLLDRSGNVVYGFHHLGMHDVENIGRCLMHLLEEGVDIQLNGWMR